MDLNTTLTSFKTANTLLKTHIAICVWLCLITNTYAQDYYPLDSINALKDKVELFSKQHKNDSALFYKTLIIQKYKRNFEKGVKENNDTYILESGIPYVDKLQIDLDNDSLAVIVAKKILPAAIIKQDTTALLQLYTQLGQSYFYTKDYGNSVLYLKEAETILSTETSGLRAFEVYFYLAKSTQKFDTSTTLAYLKKAEMYIGHASNFRKYRLYKLFADVSTDFNTILFYYRKQKEFLDLILTKKRALTYYNNLAFTYFEHGKVKEAKALLEDNLPWCTLNSKFKSCESEIQSYFLHTVGAIEYELGNFNEALYCFETALEMVKAENDYEDIIFYSTEIARLYEKTKQYEKGFKMLLPLEAYRDSLTEIDIETEIKKRQNKHLLDKEKNTVEQLTVENKRINISISRLTFGIYCLILIIGLAIYINVITKLRQIKIQQAFNLNQLQNLTAAMNPHFLFNCFSTLQNLILNNDTKEANNYMGNLARLIRHFFFSFENINIPFQKEVEILESYCRLEALRQNDEFSYSIFVKPELRNQHFMLPSMLIQPIVENAFKHAFTEKDKSYYLSIKFKPAEDSDYIMCCIVDNGIGREKSEAVKQTSNHLSISSRNLKERIRIIQKHLKKKATIEIVDLKDEDNQPIGTEVILTLPKIKPQFTS